MDFFDDQSDSSAVKAEIIKKYFSAWARILSRNNERIGYIDLFSGPGCYEDGAESTPILLLKEALGIPGVPKKLMVHFNDASSEKIQSLQENVCKIPGIEAILPQIKFSNGLVDAAISQEVNQKHLIPAFSFIDPFGYAGVTKQLITGLTKDRGCDCVFFLNYSRINAGINNPLVESHMEALFDENILNLRNKLSGHSPKEREEIILETLSRSFERINGQKAFVLPFRFCRLPGAKGTRTSHYLIFLSKHKLGYKIMKDIMYSSGNVDDSGIGTFEFVPVQNNQLTLLFGYNQTIDQLKDNLCMQYRGRTLSVAQIYDLDSYGYGTRFILPNYKEALRQLEQERRIRCNPAARQIRRGVMTMADHVKITFL